jgi:hypothetical protein
MLTRCPSPTVLFSRGVLGVVYTARDGHIDGHIDGYMWISITSNQGTQMLKVQVTECGRAEWRFMHRFAVFFKCSQYLLHYGGNVASQVLQHLIYLAHMAAFPSWETGELMVETGLWRA